MQRRINKWFESVIHLKSRVTFVYFSSVLEGGVTSLVWNVPLNYSEPNQVSFSLLIQRWVSEVIHSSFQGHLSHFLFSTDILMHFHSISLSLCRTLVISVTHCYIRYMCAHRHLKNVDICIVGLHTRTHTHTVPAAMSSIVCQDIVHSLTCFYVAEYFLTF